jgi:hypothetical protein
LYKEKLVITREMTDFAFASMTGRSMAGASRILGFPFIPRVTLMCHLFDWKNIEAN